MPLGERLEGGRRIDTETGLIMPWYTSPCLEWLLTLDLKGKRVFEYGVGDSTAWYRSKESRLRGVDSDMSWAIKCLAIHETDKEDYIKVSCECGRALMPSGSFSNADWDIVVIDGVYRDECTEYALKSLKSGGYLIIDNWKQPSADLEHWPLTEKLIDGMPITVYKEPGHEDWVTVVITKP